MAKTINLYLSGPMYLGKEQATGWRVTVKNIIKAWLDTEIPTASMPPYIGYSGIPPRLFNRDLVDFYFQDPCDRWYDKGTELTNVGGYVVQMDKMEIEKSHVVLVNASDPGWGTPMEQYIAFTTGKMVIAFSDCEYPSIWAVAHSHMMFKNHVKAADFICKIAKNVIKAV